jgi:4-amino-4-deoxy-L-arabinose transferase-like glycosyltransferase
MRERRMALPRLVNPPLARPGVASMRPLLVLLVVFSLAAGLGMRDPVPPDEPRFLLAAQQMVESGQWLFPHRGAELYADKPPMFMWLQAASYVVTGNWQVAFLLPSLLAALATLALTWDAGRRLWSPKVAGYAAFALFACLQFGLQAKRGQIDMVVVAMTTLSLWALLRYFLERGDARWLALGAFAAGLGTVTKGVGFLPLLLVLPWLIARRMRPSLAQPSSRRAAHVLVAAGGFLAGVGLWLVPMLVTVRTSGDPALAAYANEILWKQTGTRYAQAWQHVKPAWYYLQAVAFLWLPGVLLAPWLLPAWWRRLRRGDPRQVMLLGWSALVLAFFTVSAGKRGVYVFPVLPALCMAAAPLLPGLLRIAAARLVLAAYVWAIAAGAGVAGAVLRFGPADRLQALVAERGFDVADLRLLGAWLLALGVAVAAIGAWRRRAHAGTAVVLVTAAVWSAFGLGIVPALEADSSARELMQETRARIGPQAELALLGWREQQLLQAGPGTVEFGFKRAWHLQWADAGPWLARDPSRRWLFVLDEAIGPCVDRAQAVLAGHSNRREWWLVPGTAWKPGCETPPFNAEDAGRD